MSYGDPTSAIIRWEDPPATRFGCPRGHSWSSLQPIADELRANPGRWAVVYEHDDSHRRDLAFKIRMGQVACFAPAGDFDAVSRRVNGKQCVYAIYMGDGDEHAVAGARLEGATR